MASNNRSYARAKSTISLGRLQELMKEHIGEPTDEWMEGEDVTIKLYLDFFLALAQETARLNPVAVAVCADSLWKLGKNKAHLFGTALENAFSYAKRAGDKALDGSKLTSEVRQLYIAITGKWPGVKLEPSPLQVEPSLSVKEEQITPVKGEPGKLKGEPVVKEELCQVKQELAQSKAEQSCPRCLTSPARILQLYQVQFSASETPSKKPKVDLHVWICAYECGDIYMYICISNIIQGGEGAWYSWCLNILH